ncbi:MAG: hypothetical protein JSS30_00755 [Verrucomicrobia bacterium]|nr:hypothetical protein [Verrucomicrobiota bacterium]
MITEDKMSALEELEDLITEAMKRVSVRKETDLCQYIGDSNGRLHHFAFGKLKKKNPEELSKMVRTHILDKDTPVKLAPKPRARYKSKQGVDIKLTKTQLSQLLNVLKLSSSNIQGADELISALAPHQTVKQVQKLMIDMVRERKIDAALWETYVKLVNQEGS